LPLDVDMFVDDGPGRTRSPRVNTGASRIVRRVERKPLALPAPGERAGRTADRAENRCGHANHGSARKFDADSPLISGQRLFSYLLGFSYFREIRTPFIKVVYNFN